MNQNQWTRYLKIMECKVVTDLKSFLYLVNTDAGIY